MNGDEAAEEHLTSMLIARDEALAAGEESSEGEAEVPPELVPRLGRALAALKLLHEARPRGHPQSATPMPGEHSTGPGVSDSAPSAFPSRIGRFQILHELGRGGFGVVFLAHDPRLGREVALKVPRFDALLSTELRERFQQEARAAAGLDHPNIVAVHESGEAGPVCYMASAYCPGPTLAAWLRQQVVPVPLPDAARLVATLATAIQHAHSRGVLHRDLKPSNILLQMADCRWQIGSEQSAARHLQSAIAKITDFGLAKLAEQGVETRTGQVLGTAAYMAPEQARGSHSDVGPAADLYALGVILYELLTGRPPFRGETDWETLRQIQTEEALPPSRLRKLPRDLETICLKCLEKDPRRRYGCADDLAGDLERYLAGKPIQARPVSAVARAGRWCQRRPAVAGLAAALAVVGIASLAGLTVLWLRAERLGGIAKVKQLEAEEHLHLAQMHQQRAQASYQLARASLEESVKKVAEDPRVKSGPLEDLRRTVLQAETSFYQKFVALQGDEPDFQEERGRAFNRLGDVSVALGMQPQALEQYRQAQAILAALVQADSAVPRYRATLAAGQHQLAKLHMNMGEFEAAEEVFRTALTVESALAREHPEVFSYHRNLASTYANLGVLHALRLGRTVTADHATRQALARACEDAYRESAKLLEELARNHPANPDSRYLLGKVYINVGNLHYEMQRFPQAEESLLKAGVVLRDFVSNYPEHEDCTIAQRGLANGLSSLATVYLVTERPLESEKAYKDALAIQEALVVKHPLVLDYAIAVGNTQANLGNRARLNGDPAASLKWFSQAVTTLEGMLAKQPQHVEVQAFLRNAHLGSAAACNETQRHAEALTHLERALALDDGRLRIRCLLERALTFARLKEHVRAAAEATALAEIKDVSPTVLYYTGCVFALSTQAILPHEPLAEQYAVRCVDLLRRALAAGFKDVELLKTNPDFVPLRAREDFKRLLLQAGSAAEPTGVTQGTTPVPKR